MPLFGSLNDYIKFRDLYHVQKVLEDNSSEKKKTYQIPHQTREQLDIPRRDTIIDSSGKEKEAVNRIWERKQFQESHQQRCQTL
jgi:hypothetical protein